MDLSNANIVLIADQDEASVRGNAMASGDDDFDREVEDSIIDRLGAGDVWAWAQVEVYAEIDLNGVTVRSESDYLGGCSYDSEEDFQNNSGYYDDMKANALDSLREKLDALKAALC